MRLVEQQSFDVVILDLNLPDMDGLQVCAEIKAAASREIPILMLTARDSLEDKGAGFDAGTDDYLVKPFDVEEVAMRCLALARRERLHKGRSIEIGDLSIDTRSQEVSRQGRAITLSLTDFKLLLELARAFPRAVSRNQLQQRVWGDEYPESDVLRTHMYTLRQAVDKPFDSPLVKTVHGVGFRLVDSQGHKGDSSS